ncbi:helix-turn-helix domain-containing protein [Ancylomarina sp. DW003]|nr:helix-turn-helix domain-containing protein [Ancylomarina sp. DW003]MDE5423859.1 helix-turn-helix domain-containing protein [Ancylomarina sp. DW003]
MLREFTYQPNYALSQYVDFIWMGKASDLDIQSGHHAALFTELIFNYGDNFQIDGQNIEQIVNKNDHHIISGLKTAPFQTHASGRYGSVGLILKPFCYGILINKFGTHAMDQISEILHEHLFISEQPQFNLVEKHLLQLFDNKHIDKDLLKFESYISSEILSKGTLKNFNLSLSISQKSFIQKFKKHYLLTPGEYAKLKQVNYAIQLLQNKTCDKLIHAGLDSGFYDQSHFTRIFKKFCGLTPKQFVQSIKKE